MELVGIIGISMSRVKGTLYIFVSDGDVSGSATGESMARENGNRVV